MRDVRISQIYEGTNAIQALDLVGRKLGIEQGRLFKSWLAEVETTIKSLEGRNDMGEFIAPLKDALVRLKSVTLWMIDESATDPNARGAAAVDYLRLFALTAFAWIWVRMVDAAIAKKGASGDAYYDAKIEVGRYFMKRVLPQTLGLDAVIRAGSKSMMTLPEAAF